VAKKGDIVSDSDEKSEKARRNVSDMTQVRGKVRNKARVMLIVRIVKQMRANEKASEWQIGRKSGAQRGENEKRKQYVTCTLTRREGVFRPQHTGRTLLSVALPSPLSELLFAQLHLITRLFSQCCFL
jgi:hypothetical protein